MDSLSSRILKTKLLYFISHYLRINSSYHPQNSYYQTRNRKTEPLWCNSSFLSAICKTLTLLQRDALCTCNPGHLLSAELVVALCTFTGAVHPYRSCSSLHELCTSTEFVYRYMNCDLLQELRTSIEMVHI